MTYARVAGIVFLCYIAAGLAETAMFAQALGSGSAEARLARLSEHATLIRLSTIPALVTIISALVLSVALFSITRQYGLELAVLALCARCAEAVIGAVYIVSGLAMLSLANASDTASAAAVFRALSSLRDGAMVISAICFAFGSTVFAYLFLRARNIPVPLAWLGMAASLILMVALPLQVATGASAAATWIVWLPMLVFELVLAAWLIVRGVAPPRAPIA